MKIKKAKLYMDTVVEIQVVTDNTANLEAEEKINQAFDAFRRVEDACSRFTTESELMKVSQIIGKPVQVSPYLFEPLKFALEIAEFTNGVFDPTIGNTLEKLGFNRHYLTGQMINSKIEHGVTYQDIILDSNNRTVLFKKPMVIDLGAVAKGFAIDLAAKELQGFSGFLVNAGGDLFAGGLDDDGEKWEIGIQHPFDEGRVIHSIKLSDESVCTSGSYERRSKKTPGTHHIVNPYSKKSPNEWVSCSVIAPFAMMADAFSTTAFLLCVEDSVEMISEAGAKGIFITPDLEMTQVGGI